MSDFLADLMNTPIPEETSLGRDFEDLPTKVWVRVRCAPEGTGAAAGVETFGGQPDEQGNPRAAWHRLKVGLIPIGAEQSVVKKPYSSLFVRMDPCEYQQPGVVSKRMMGFINALFAPGTPHNSPERQKTALDVLKLHGEEAGVGPEGYADGPTYLAALAAVGMGKQTPTLLVKTMLRKGKAYTDRETGEQRQGKDQITVGDFEDDTPANRTARGIVDWEESELTF